METLNAIVMMGMEVQTALNQMSMNVNTDLAQLMPNVPTHWAVLLVLVMKAMKEMVSCASQKKPSMRCHTKMCWTQSNPKLRRQMESLKIQILI